MSNISHIEKMLREYVQVWSEDVEQASFFSENGVYEDVPMGSSSTVETK